jgi:hypothetical protein
MDASVRLIDSAGFQSLESLVMEGIPVDDQVILNLTQLLQSKDGAWLSLELICCPLVVVDNEINWDIWNQFVQALARVKHLVLSSEGLSMGRNYFFPVEGALNGISSLQIVGAYWHPDHFRRLSGVLQKSMTLKEFALLCETTPRAERFSIMQLSYLMEGLRENRSIVTLNLQNSLVNDEHASLLISSLLEAQNSTIKTLDLSENGLGDDTLLALNTWMMQGACLLQVLDLSRQPNPLRVSLLAPAMRQVSSRLKSLYLSQCHVIDDEATVLLEALTHNNHLENLDWSMNRDLSISFCMYLGEQLPHLSLKTLNIRKLHAPNGSRSALEALSKGLSENTKLQLLQLVFSTTSESAQWIQIYINLNRGGRQALDYVLPLSLWPRVLKRAQQRLYYYPVFEQSSSAQDATFHLLRNAPDMWKVR